MFEPDTVAQSNNGVVVAIGSKPPDEIPGDKLLGSFGGVHGTVTLTVTETHDVF